MVISRKNLGTVAVLAGGVSTLIPGYAFFEELAPPLFQPLGLLTSGLAVAALIWGYSQRKEGIGIGSMLGGVVLLLVYMILLTYWTVAAPASRPDIGRQQVGFGLAEWSLGDHGLENAARLKDVVSESGRPVFGTVTPRLLIEADAAYNVPEKIRLIWKPWTIIVAGTVLVALFLLGFVAWTYGIGRLARYLNREEPASGHA